MNGPDKIRQYGFKAVVTYSGWGDSELSKIKDFIIDRLELFPEVISLIASDDDVGFAIISRAYEKGTKLSIDGPMKPFIDKFSNPENLNIGSVMSWNSRAGDQLKVLSMVEGYDWKDIFDKAIEWVSNRRFYGETFSVILSQAAKQHSDHFLSIANEKVFKQPGFDYNVRQVFYPAIIKAGLLTPKMARKMRSDASEYASQGALEALLAVSSDLYPNKEQLLLVFSDSKHQTVVRTLADKLPKHLLYSLLGTEFHWLKPIIDRRMSENEE